MDIIDKYLDQFLESYQIPGIGVGICYNNEIIYQKVKGIADVTKGNGLTLDSIFPMASISKVFSAMAGMQLAEQGRIDAEGSILQYLPGFSPEDPRYAEISMKHLLSHTSGIPDLTDYDWLNPRYDDAAAASYLKEIESVPLFADPGTAYQYSNRAYNIMGQLVREVTGQTIEEYIEKNIFGPLAMNSSTFLYGDVPEERRVTPHTMGKGFRISPRKVYPYNRIHAPSSTLHATIPDMMQWIKVWLNGGILNGKRLLSKENCDRMLVPVVETEKDTWLCLGWKKLYRHGVNFFISVGGAPGFRSFLILAPEKNIGVIVVHNSDLVTAEGLSIDLLSMLMRQDSSMPVPPLYMQLGKWIHDEGLESALERYYTYKREHPAKYDYDPSFLVSLGYILLHKFHMCNEAIAVFGKGLEENPGFWRAYNGMGEAYRRLGRIEEAIECYNKSLSINTTNPVAIAALNECSVFMNRAKAE
jgi:CubicO group peptidase (beta-lactamase class C family)